LRYQRQRVPERFHVYVRASETRPEPFRPVPRQPFGTVEAGSPPGRETVEFARIVAFTDGVFAIAITVLVLSLDVPPDLADEDLHDHLIDAWPQLFAYFLSFAVIGRFWIAHHEVFSMLHDFDRRLMALNLVYLSMVVLIPFPTELLGEFGSETDSVVLYAAVVGTAALLSWALLRAGLRFGLVEPQARARAGPISAGMLRPALVFYASIPVAFVSPLAGQLFWLTMIGGRRRRT
jgi:uncharacterized membrane protein